MMLLLKWDMVHIILGGLFLLQCFLFLAFTFNSFLEFLSVYNTHLFIRVVFSIRALAILNGSYFKFFV